MKKFLFVFFARTLSLFALLLVLTSSIFSQSLPSDSIVNDMRLVPPGTTIAKIDTASMRWHTLKSITVNVPYFIDTAQISWAQYNLIRTWANVRGYDLDSGNTYADYVVPKNWFDAVKFCNARSEYKGLTPAYYTSISHDTIYVGGKQFTSVTYDSVYRIGNLELSDEYVDTTANGYKLPTSNQWLLAAYTANLNLFGVNYSWGSWTAGANVCWDRYYLPWGSFDGHAHWLWIPVDSVAIYTAVDEQQAWNSLRCVRNYVLLPDTTPQVSVTEPKSQAKTFMLYQNFPNPFNPATVIKYSLPTRSRVHLYVCNVLGQVVADLVNTEQQTGIQSVAWNANVSSGLYFYRLEAVSLDNPGKRFVETKKMLLIR